MSRLTRKLKNMGIPALSNFLSFCPFFFLPGHTGSEILPQVSTVGPLCPVNPREYHTDVPQVCLINR